MSIIYRFELINFLIDKFNFKNYLEIGLDTGINFNQIKCQNKVSVDPALPPYEYVTPTYKMTSDEFFSEVSNQLELFDIIFIDGLHESKQVDRDIENSLNHLSDGGFIIVHDCNPMKEVHQHIPRVSKMWSGDVWKSIVKFRNGVSDHGCVVIDIDYGLGVISNRIPKSDKMRYRLNYQSLEDNRVNYLGLIGVEEFEKII